MPVKRGGQSKAEKQQALSRFRLAKSQGRNALDDDADDSDDEDIYDEVTEEQYREIVHARQEREDFVVDDDGLGYADDGEELMYKTETTNDSNSKRKAATITEKTLKQVKKLKQTTNAAANDKKQQPKLWALWGRSASDSGGNSNKPSNSFAKTPNVDELLGQLDNPVVLSRSRKSKKKSKKRTTGSRPRHYHEPTEDPMPPQQDDDPYQNHQDDEIPMEDEPMGPKEDHHDVPVDSASSPVDAAKSNNEEKDEPKEEPAERKPIKRKFARTKLSDAKPKPVAAPQTNTTPKPTIAIQNSIPTEGEALAQATVTKTFGTVDLATVTKTDDNGDAYFDMFWFDLAELRNGQVILFGKVDTGTQYVSCSVMVTNMMRNLFVLPKPDAALSDIHQELSELFLTVLPKNAVWAAKPVKRNYAFDDVNVPRECTEYLKVVYDAQYPFPDESICENGGTHYSKILSANVSLTEHLLIKRKLTGPSWIRIMKPESTRSAHTWCKLECSIASPKHILPVQDPPKAPTLSTMSLHMKTVVHPKTHKSEIVVISAVYHSAVNLEGSTIVKHQQQQQLTLIRPLNHFPRQLEESDFQKHVNERSLLSRFLAQVGQWDPDVICGHNLWGFLLPVLSERCRSLKLPNRLGRRRQSEWPKNDWGIAQAAAGRLVVDTYTAAQEFLRETTYSLSHLAHTQLQTTRHEIEPLDIPAYYEKPQGIVHLAKSTLWDAQLVQKLLFKLQVLPLTKQLTNIAGNLWSQTLRSNRAGRTEYLLLHEFHRLKFLPPEKKRKSQGNQRTNAKYSGGLVLEPKKGLYDSFILLLDFNSLYPSLIQEYNLCFTTIDWANLSDDTVPTTPDPDLERGVLPRVIKSLVDRRRTVKNFLKSEGNPEKQRELDIRQQALKLTANSMYGCLGYSNSRFYAQPIAALVTSMGRETLQRTVDVAQGKVGLDVIYGDTDSIMINTRINDTKQLGEVKRLGELVKKEVNGLYKTLELEIDGIFRSMLLLKKKKYAAKTVLEVLPDGTITYGQEMKGLDLVRRDWCIQSKDTGRFITEKILSGDDTESVVETILAHLEALAKEMREGKLPLDKYTITKGLSKHPNDYPDAKSQMHVQVAKRMLLNGKAVNTGDHIPYIVTEVSETQEGQKVPSPAERARHPEEIKRSDGVLKPDVEWYLSQQILPPVSRLCEPIEGLSQQTIADKLGLEASRYQNHASQAAAADQEISLDYTPASSLSDEERFKNVEKLKIHCITCGHYTDIPGVFATESEAGVESLVTGLRCTNPNCVRPTNWGHPNHFECYSRITNNMKLWVKGLTTRYYEGVVRCDEASCGLVTRQCSVAGSYCLRIGCNGRLVPVDIESQVYEHLKYLSSVFDVDHALKQWEKKKSFGGKKDLASNIRKDDRKTFEQLHLEAKQYLEESAFHWVTPSFWNEFFCAGAKQ